MQLKHLSSLAFAIALCGAAHAGLHIASPVRVDTTLNQASGYLGAAYNTANSTEYIGCGKSATPGNISGWCVASNGAGLQRSCATTSPELLNVIGGLDGSGAVAFTWDANGTCTSILVSTYSFMDPKLWSGAAR